MSTDDYGHLHGTHQADLFAGAAYVPELDRERLGKQIRRVYDCMLGGAWRTLGEVSRITGDPEGSVGSQLRNLRMERFGRHKVDRRRRGDPAAGLFEYRLGAQAVEAFQVPRSSPPQATTPTADASALELGLAFEKDLELSIALVQDLSHRSAALRLLGQAHLFTARRELESLLSALQPSPKC
jgi:hypothetical protein